MTRRTALLLPLLVGGVLAQDVYDGPRPSMPDLPFLVKNGMLIATEQSEARPQKRKRDLIYVIEGAASPVRIRNSSPIFLMQSEQIPPEVLGLYKLDVENGHRQIVFPGRKPPQPMLVKATKLGGNLFEISFGEKLQPGEYSLSPEGSNAVFCFAVDAT